MSRLKKAAGDLSSRIENANKVLNDLSGELQSIVYNLEQYIKTNSSTIEDNAYEELSNTIDVINKIYYAVEDGSTKLNKDMEEIKKSLN